MSTIGAVILCTGIALWLFHMALSARSREPAGADTWDARTLEWSVASPPPEYDFDQLPLVRGRDTPAVLAAAMTAFAHATRYRVTLVMVLSAVLAPAGLHVYMWRSERHEVLPFVAESEN